MYNEAAKKATIKYKKENCEQLNLTLKKGTKDKWKTIAKSKRKSLTEYIEHLIEEDNKNG